MGKHVKRSLSTVRTFTDSAPVRREIRELRDKVGEAKQFSDIVDGLGHQYVDLVLEGGGVLGIALVGYLYALEQVGIRFLQIGGTSAGSVVALLLAALGSPAEAKSRRIVQYLAEVDLNSFVVGTKMPRTSSMRSYRSQGAT